MKLKTYLAEEQPETPSPQPPYVLLSAATITAARVQGLNDDHVMAATYFPQSPH